MAPLNLTQADIEVHAKLHIPGSLLDRAGVRRVTDTEARELLTSRHHGDLAGLAYPYRNPISGATVTYRVRRDHPEIDAGRPVAKYLSAYGDHRHLYFPPDAAVLLDDPVVPYVDVEAEKSVLAIMASAARIGRDVLAVGTGGVSAWRGRIGKTTDEHGVRVDERGPLSDHQLITWMGREVVILSDSNISGNAALLAERRKRADYLQSLGARVRVAQVPVEDGVNGPDDYVGRHGDEALWALIENAKQVQPANPEDVLAAVGLDTIDNGSTAAHIESALTLLAVELRGATPLRVNIVRGLVIAKLKEVKIPAPATLVNAALASVDSTEAAPVGGFLEDDPPSEDSVDGAGLLAALSSMLTRYMVLPPHAAAAVALWILLTFATPITTTLPLLLITSPTKRCGKTRLVALLTVLCRRALPVSNISAPALFRAVAKWEPTLILDEADTFLKDSDDLRGVINSGHTRTAAQVIRCVGDNHEPTPFPTWCPKALAMIRKPPDTVVDRAIVVSLTRKGPGDTVAHMEGDTIRESGLPLRRACVRWAADALGALRAAHPALPAGLHDRARDNWRPLLAIADVAGGAWPSAARVAALALSGADADDEPITEQLLADLRTVFTDEDTVFPDEKRDRLPTARVVELLVAMETKPWATYGRTGKPLSPHQLARLLRGFGVKSTKTKVNRKTENVYVLAHLQPVWDRYTPLPQVGTVEPANVDGPISTFSGWNQIAGGSNQENTNRSMNTEAVPRFQPVTDERQGDSDDKDISLVDEAPLWADHEGGDAARTAVADNVNVDADRRIFG